VSVETACLLLIFTLLLLSRPSRYCHIDSAIDPDIYTAYDWKHLLLPESTPPV